MATLRSAEQEQLQKLLLGQLPTAEIERMATEFADDSRLAELAESLVGKDDALLSLLQNHEASVVDPEGERLVERLLQRLKPAIPVKPGDETFAVNKADATTEPSSFNVAAMLPVLPERLEYYRPIKVLGQGGMGTVYLAEDTRLGREVAIKTLRPELAINAQAKERFLREARSAAKLEHDHIIPIYSVAEADGTPFLAMPFLKGEPLDALIRRAQGQLPVATAVRLAREVASGLAAAHARGLIHRDIKPANIWLEAPTGRVKILDFGLAKAADTGNEVDSETHLTASGAIVGTPAYMAPEQASGNPIDGRADLFSLGCVLYELLTGRRAFAGANTMSILMSLATHTPVAPDTLSSECPAALSQLVMQLLAKDPAKRPASAEAVIQALSELDSSFATATQNSNVFKTSGVSRTEILQLSDSSLEQPPTRILSFTKPTHSKRRLAFALFGTLLLLLAAVVYRIQTDKGTLIVEIVDEAVEAKLKTSGLEVRDSTSGRSFSIQAEGSLREPSGDFKVVDGQGLKLVVLDADGLELKTNEFKLTRDGKVRVRVTAEANGVAPTNTPQTIAADRRAAEYVLSIGGKIKIDELGVVRDCLKIEDLPNETFRLVGVDFNSSKQVTDEGLGVFDDCRDLRELEFSGPEVNDDRLSHFRNCKQLRFLRMRLAENVTNKGLAHFRDCRHLAYLEIHAEQVSHVGLSHFHDCKELTLLRIISSRLTDEGLAHFTDLENLTTLSLGSHLMTDAGLAHFSVCKKLATLEIASERVTDAGFRHFQSNKELTLLTIRHVPTDGAFLSNFQESLKLARIDFDGTNLSDDHFLGLAKFPRLRYLFGHQTKVTEAAVKQLSAAMPECTFYWDGKLIEPTISPDRRAAEYVLSISAPGIPTFIKIMADGEKKQLAAGDALPNTPFDLTDVVVSNNERLDDAGLARFKGCRKLEYLQLGYNAISDAGLEAFQGSTSIKILGLTGTKVTDQGLANFQKCHDLAVLELGTTAVTDKGVALLSDCRKLTSISLMQTKVSDDGLAAFSHCVDLENLDLASNDQLTDAGMVHFRNCRKIKLLSLAFTARITDVGLACFKDCSEMASFRVQGTSITDNGLAVVEGFTNLDRLHLDYTSIIGAGLVHLKNNTKLSHLTLTRTGLTDVGLEALALLTPLTILDVSMTKVSEAGVKKLTAALPKCRITWDGGVIEPRQSPDRSAAEYVMSIAAPGIPTFIKIMADGEEKKQLAAGDALPNTPFDLTDVVVSNNERLDDAGLARFKGCRKLEYLLLSYNKIGDAGLEAFQGSTSIKTLILFGTKVTDQGLANFQKCHDLRELDLGSTAVTDKGVESLRDCRKLISLGLGETRVSDEGLAAFRQCVDLETLSLQNCDRLTDAGMSHFKKCRRLKSVTLSYAPQISDAGLACFKDCSELTALRLQGTSITDAGLEVVQGLGNLEYLLLDVTAVTDMGLAQLKNCKKLNHLALTTTGLTDTGLDNLSALTSLADLYVSNTKVTETGVKKLAAALPKCRITWNGGVIEPKASTNR